MLPQKSEPDEMEKPPSSHNDCNYFQRNSYCDSGIFSSFAHLTELELKGDNISNVSTATPINSNYNSNNTNINYNSLNNHFNHYSNNNIITNNNNNSNINNHHNSTTNINNQI